MITCTYNNGCFDSYITGLFDLGLVQLGQNDRFQGPFRFIAMARFEARQELECLFVLAWTGN